MMTVFESFQAQFLDLVGFIVCVPARGGSCYTKYDALTVGWAFVGVFVVYWYDFLVIVLFYRILLFVRFFRYPQLYCISFGS
jgi:hypothetical protein